MKKYTYTLVILFLGAFGTLMANETEEKRGTLTVENIPSPNQRGILGGGTYSQVALSMFVYSTDEDTISDFTVNLSSQIDGLFFGNAIHLYVSDDEYFGGDTYYGTSDGTGQSFWSFSNLEIGIDDIGKYLFFEVDVNDTVDASYADVTFSINDGDIATFVGDVSIPETISNTVSFESYCAARGREYLTNLYYSTNGDSWGANDNWLVDTPLSNWYGISTSNECITEILLSFNDLNGNLPNFHYEGLENVTTFNLHGNSIGGAIPESIDALTNVQLVQLSDNDMAGFLPAGLYRLSALTDLYLQGNAFSGVISNSIGNLSNLQVLELQDNDLSGNIPSSIGNLTQLDRLNLSTNQLVGGIPDSFENLISLTLLDISYNYDLIGSLPEYFADLPLNYLYVNDNFLSGEVPLEFINSSIVDFYISNTEICEPLNNTDFTDWISTISYGGSGWTCEDVIVSPLTNGVSQAPLGGGQTERGLLGFSVKTSSATTVSEMIAYSTRMVNGDLTNPKLILSIDNDLSTTDDNTDLNVSISYESESQIYIIPVTQSFQASEVKNYFLVADVSTSVSEETETIGFGINALDILTTNSLIGSDIVATSVEYEFESQTISSNRAALMALYDYTNGDNWSNNQNWNSTQPIGDWYGVAQGGLIMETFAINYTDGLLTDLTNHVDYSDNPTNIQNLNEFDIPLDVGDFYGARVRGVFQAPESGDFTFWVVGDDEFELYLSSTSDPSGKTLITSGGYQAGIGGSSYQDWSNAATSSAITLTAGNEYYIEALFIEVAGSDHLTVGWTLPSADTIASPTEPTEIISSDYFTESFGVVGLSLSANNLYGSLPDEIGNLTDLRLLDLQNNGLQGNVPSSIGNLSSLRKLIIWINGMNGELPPEIGNLTELRYLDVEANSFIGELPSSLGNLTNLRTAWLGDNGWTGEIPSSLGNLTDLQLLSLRSSNFSGEIPPELGNLSNLLTLRLDFNNLTGTIPTEFSNLSSLTSLNARNNNLDGELPSLSIPALEVLNLRGNSLTGSIPDLSGCTSLIDLYLDYNNFTGGAPAFSTMPSTLGLFWIHENQLSGSIPVEYAGFTNMYTFAFFNTNLCEPTDEEFVTWKDNLVSLGGYYGTENSCDNPTFQYLREEAQNYFVEGETDAVLFPFAVTSVSGGQLDAIQFDFSRPLNSEFANFKIVQSTDGYLGTTDDNTELTGLTFETPEDSVLVVSGIATTMSSTALNFYLLADINSGVDYGTGDLQVFVDQSLITTSDGPAFVQQPETGFTPIPWESSIYYFESAETNGDRLLLESFYSVTGGPGWYNQDQWNSDSRIDSWFGVYLSDSWRVVDLILGVNNLNGELPTLLSEFELMSLLNLAGNNLYGEIPQAYESMVNLAMFDVGGNSLSGSVPDIFTNMTSLQTFGIAGNSINGELPTSLGNTSLINLYIDNNELSGDFPGFILELDQLQRLYMQENSFSGVFPIDLINNSNLIDVAFAGNDICEPTSSEEYNSWIGTLSFFWGTDIICNTETSLLSFGFTEDPTATSDFTGAPAVVVSVDATTNPVALTAEYNLSDGANAYVSDVLQESGVSVNDFSGGLTYTIVAEDGVTATDWTITIDRPVNSEAEITAFGFPTQKSDEVITSTSATTGTVSVEARYGTDLANLIPEFILSAGADATVDDVPQESGVTVVDFESTNPRTYVVMSEDDAVTKNWEVTITVAQNDSTDFISYGFNNATITAGPTIDTDNHTIEVEIAFQEDLSALEATFDISSEAEALINGSTQTSGDAVDFSSGSVDYVIRAQDGTEQSWTVSLSVQANTATDILAFDITNQVSSDINNGARTVEIQMPQGTDVTTLVPTFDLSYGAVATISGSEQVSGSSQVDFSGNGNVPYLVTAEDGITSNVWVVSVSVIQDTESPQLTPDIPGTYLLGSGGVTISVEITDDVGVDNVNIYFKQASETSYISDEGLDPVDTDTYEYTFTDTDFDDVGLAVYFTASDAIGNISSTDTIYISSERDTNAESFAYNSFGEEQTSYRIVAFPFQNPNLDNLFEELGTYNDEEWRLLRYRNGDYDDFNRFNSIRAGEGYWLIVKDNISLNVGGPSVNVTNGEFSYPLTTTGFNLIGNPFFGRLDWDEVVNYNVDNGYINEGDIGRNPSGYKGASEGAYTSTTSILAFEGVFVEVLNSMPNFVFPTIASTGRTDYIDGSSTKQFSLNNYDWDLLFHLKGSLEYHVGGVGMKETAKAGKDHWDVPRLPQFEKFVELVFEEDFTRKVVPSADFAKWEFHIPNNLTDKQFDLSWDKPISEEYTLLLVDEANSKVIDMSQNERVTIDNDATHRYQVYFGRKDEIYSALDLEFSGISLLYPNPVKDSFKFDMFSNESGPIEVSLLDLGGKLLLSQVFDAYEGVNSFEVQVPNTIATNNSMLLMSVRTRNGQTIKQKIILQR